MSAVGMEFTQKQYALWQQTVSQMASSFGLPFIFYSDRMAVAMVVSQASGYYGKHLTIVMIPVLTKNCVGLRVMDGNTQEVYCEGNYTSERIPEKLMKLLVNRQ